MKVDFKNVGKRIRAQREKLGLSSEDIASRIGYSKSYYSHIEGGQSFSIDLLLSLSQVLNVSTDYLLTGCVFMPQTVLSEISANMDSALDERELKTAIRLYNVIKSNSDLLK